MAHEPTALPSTSRHTAIRKPSITCTGLSMLTIVTSLKNDTHYTILDRGLTKVQGSELP
jgi:hypothetical protein